MASSRERGPSDCVTRASTDFKAPSGNSKPSANMTMGSRGLTFLILVRNGGAIQKAQVVLENDRIHWLRRRQPQTLASMSCRDYGESLLPQHHQLGGIPVYAQ